MTVEYQKVWTTMNDLESVTSKICSAREIIDNAVDKIQGHEYDKAELLMNAAYEFLEYYLQDFDDKFRLAWQATVGDLRDADVKLKATYDDMVARGYWMTDDGVWMPPEKKKWILPVEETKDVDTDNTEYFVSFPEDLLEKANLNEGDEIEWIDNKDGSYTIRKVTKPVTSDV
jgi:hypothetical protein